VDRLRTHLGGSTIWARRRARCTDPDTAYASPTFIVRSGASAQGSDRSESGFRKTESGRARRRLGR